MPREAASYTPTVTASNLIQTALHSRWREWVLKKRLKKKLDLSREKHTPCANSTSLLTCGKQSN